MNEKHGNKSMDSTSHGHHTAPWLLEECWHDDSMAHSHWLVKICVCVVECAHPTDQHKTENKRKKKKTQGTHLQYIGCIFLVSLPKEASSVSNGKDTLARCSLQETAIRGTHILSLSLAASLDNKQTRQSRVWHMVHLEDQQNKRTHPTWYFTLRSGAPVQTASRRCDAPSSHAKTCCASSRRP